MVTSLAALAVSEVRWQPCFRIISSRFPPIHLFERVSDPEDWEALYWLESLTNPRLREEVGDIDLVPREDRVFGPGTSVIMAAFTHLNPDGSRFADSTFGAFYAAASLDTAIAETRYHREIFLRATREPPIELDMRTYVSDIVASFHDIRGRRNEMPDIYDPISYAASQKLARSLKGVGSNGIVFDSVRDQEGQCIAVYRPRLVQNCRQSTHLRYVWNGDRISHVYTLTVLGDS
jgi:RES domain